MDQRARDLKERGDQLFSKRRPMLTLWQTQAENFYPERADFTHSRSLGEEFASYLMSGLPALCRRDLANSLAAMLRPKGQPWAMPKTDSEAANNDPSGKRWLEDKGKVLRGLFYDTRSQFVGATKEADHDFVTFGNAVMRIDLAETRDYILYATRHPRDVAWSQNANQVMDEIHDDHKLQARQLVRKYGAKVDAKVRDSQGKDVYREIPTRRIVLPSDEYETPSLNFTPGGIRGRKLPFCAITIDCENETVLEETWLHELNYIVPRWMRWPGTAFGTSPATVIALPDARMLQQVLLTVLESGQKAVDPPMKVVGDAVQGDLNVFAGGATVVEADYDERTGRAIEPIWDSHPNLEWGDKREERIEASIRSAFMLDQIRMPGMDGKKMTATEFRGLYEDYVRQNLPLFEPVETEYSAALCEKTFNIGLRNGAFGGEADMPQCLKGRDITFEFDSPLKNAANRADAQKFQEALGMLSQAMQLDPASRYDLDLDKALRGAFDGIELPAVWVVDPDAAEKLKTDARTQQAIQAASATVAQGADIAQRVGAAGSSLKEAGMVE